MVNELKAYQSQVNATRFEIERLDRQMGTVKELFFASKKNQVIYEDMEGEQQAEEGPGMQNIGGPNDVRQK
jgi:hypothetical protein